MKTAICIPGIGRSIEHTFENLKENLINCWEDRDVYVYLGKSEMSSLAESLFKQLDRCEVKVVDEEDLDETDIVLHPSITGPERLCTVQSTLRMFRSKTLVCEFMNSFGKKYDRVIMSREDVVYTEPVNKSIEPLDMSKLWLPDWHHWLNGYHDRFAVSNHEYMTTYSQMSNHMREYHDRYGFAHAETFTRLHLDKHLGTKNIKTFFIEFHRVRPDGEIMPEGMPNPQERRYM